MEIETNVAPVALKPSRSISDVVWMYVQRIKNPCWPTYKAQGGLSYEEMVTKYSSQIIDDLIDFELERQSLSDESDEYTTLRVAA